jgi:hypothetical protein
VTLARTASDRGWLRRRSPEPGIDWGFIAYWVFTGAFIGTSLAVFSYYGPGLWSPGGSVDSTLYFRATEAWLNGADPWAVTSPSGIYFAGLPTTLLLNLPLVPFGPGVVRAFWFAADLAGWLAVMRTLRLPPWWILFPPFIDAWSNGNPDPALAGLIVVGGGAIAAIAKPYTVPAMLGEGRLRALVGAAAIAAITLPVLPWGSFFARFDDIQRNLITQGVGMSAWGNAPLMLAVVVALVLLGPRLGLLLTAPSLWPYSQLHYSIFSARAGASSAFLALVLAIPHAAPYGVIVYAAAVRLMPAASARFGRVAAPGQSSPQSRSGGGDER